MYGGSVHLPSRLVTSISYDRFICGYSAWRDRLSNCRLLLVCRRISRFLVIVRAGELLVPKITCSTGENSGATYEIGTDALSGTGGGVYPNVRNGAGVTFGCHSTVQFELATYVPSLWEGGSPVTVSDTVTPGDKMSVSVSYAHSLTTLTCKINYCFVITLHDVTKGWTATAAVYDPTARRGEADFYLVRASPTTSLPHFGKLSTSGDYVTIGLSSSSTTGKRATLVYWSASTSLNSPNASVSYYVMVNTLGNSLATPSGLTKTGFSITFNLAS